MLKSGPTSAAPQVCKEAKMQVFNSNRKNGQFLTNTTRALKWDW